MIIPVKPGGEVRAVARLAAVDYPEDAFEVLVAEGRQPSRQRNRAAQMARGEILYFLDDDSLLEPGNLRRLSSQYADPAVVAVGGPSLTPADDSRRQRCFGLALASVFGGGGVRNRYRRAGALRAADDRELILCNLSFRAAGFRDSGGFDERLYPNEENELLTRLARQGGRILHDPDLAVWRSQRPTFTAFVRQLFTYGRGRAEQTLLGGGAGILTFVPTLFLLYLCLLPFGDNPVYYLPLLCYAIADMLFALLAAAPAGCWLLAPCLLLVFPLLHLSYGAGMLAGFIAPRFRRNRPASREPTIRIVKGMTDGSAAASRANGRH
ncbi:MAG TPA: glycosyltransferase [Geobacteraceae bacterium]